MTGTIYTAGQVSKIATLTDGTLEIRLRTQELPPEKVGALFGLMKSHCYFGIKVEDFGNEEREALEALKADALEFNQKTSSQRLRAVLYRCFETNSEGYTDFLQYYEFKMGRMIEHFKSKLPH